MLQGSSFPLYLNKPKRPGSQGSQGSWGPAPERERVEDGRIAAHRAAGQRALQALHRELHAGARARIQLAQRLRVALHTA